MTSFKMRSAAAIAALALLTACGGAAAPDDDRTATAALMVHQNAPVADCEAEGCNRPRIIDGNAEQYRAGAAPPPQQAEPAPADAPQPATQAARSQPAGLAGQAPSAAAPAADAPPR